MLHIPYYRVNSNPRSNHGLCGLREKLLSLNLGGEESPRTKIECHRTPNAQYGPPEHKVCSAGIFDIRGWAFNVTWRVMGTW